MDEFIFTPIRIDSIEQLEQFIYDNYFPRFSPADSGFDKTVEVMTCYRNMSELVRILFTYLVQTLQTGNFVDYAAGRSFNSFRR